ncbi:MAG: hypothetical protein P4M13_04595, partial [Alphaproteobacteria bacterium]|nr:hypothetical protein [Alphaproteobacteria bacterium]
ARLAKTLILRPFEIEKSVAVWTIASYKQTPKHWSRTTFRQARDHLWDIRVSLQEIHQYTKK